MSFTLDPRKAFEQKLVELGRRNERIIAVSCDSAEGGGLGRFIKEFPDRKVEVGISEQNAVSICAALSRQGFIPVLVIINPFLTMRAFEQVRDDLGYMNTNVKIVGSGGGLAYSTLGSSHMAIEDIALMRTVPNLTIFAPGDADEVESLLGQAMAIKGPVYIRMPRQARSLPRPAEQRCIVAGQAEILAEGEDIAIFTYGPSVEEAMKAAAILRRNGIGTAVVDMATIKPLDTAAILKQATAVKQIVVLEEHLVTGGLGSAVAEVLAGQAAAVPLHVFGVPEGSKNTGPYHELLDYYGLTGEKVAEWIMENTCGKGEINP